MSVRRNLFLMAAGSSGRVGKKTQRPDLGNEIHVRGFDAFHYRSLIRAATRFRNARQRVDESHCFARGELVWRACTTCQTIFCGGGEETPVAQAF
jgi:hypothetical protein